MLSVGCSSPAAATPACRAGNTKPEPQESCSLLQGLQVALLISHKGVSRCMLVRLLCFRGQGIVIAWAGGHRGLLGSLPSLGRLLCGPSGTRLLLSSFLLICLALGSCSFALHADTHNMIACGAAWAVAYSALGFSERQGAHADVRHAH